jgi:hypothetical protein
MDWVAWVEGELLGEFSELDAAIAEAGMAAIERHADVVVENLITGDEMVVRVEARTIDSPREDR